MSGTELDATTQCAIAATNCRRHSLATHMLEKGASTREVQHQLTFVAGVDRALREGHACGVVQGDVQDRVKGLDQAGISYNS